MSITVVSSNVRFDNPADGDHSWERRRELLARVLRSHSPDVIATQEGRRPQSEDLAGLLPRHRLATSHRHWIDERMYPCLYWNESLPEPRATGDAWLSETPEVAGSSSFGSAFPRLLTWMRVRLGGRETLVVNTHLDHVREETRIEQAHVLASQIQRLRGDSPLILLGDFNAGPTSSVREALLGAFPGLYDPWERLGRAEESSHHPFTGEWPEGKRIDWILLDARCVAEEVFLDKTREGGRWPSDHFPLVCRFRF